MTTLGTATILRADARALPLPDASVDSIVCDPPYALPGGFMGRSWDRFDEPRAFQQWCEVWAREAHRVLKPGGFFLSFGGTRTYHRLTCAIEDAGFEIRDSMAWMYGCLDDQTEIMVDGQWEPYHKVKQGHHALGYDIERDEFSWQPIQRVVVFPYSDTAYRLVGDHTDQLVTREHRCIVERGGSYVFQEAQEAAREREARVPVLEDVRGLLDALPLPHQGASDAQPDLLEGMRQPAGRRGEQRAAQRECQSSTHVPGVQQAVPAFADEATRGPGPGVLAPVSRSAGLRPAAGDGVGRPIGMDRHLDGVIPDQDDRAGEPRMEGRGDLLPQARELQGSQVRPVSHGVRGDGPQGRVRDGAPTASSEGDGQAVDTAGGGSPRGPRSGQQCTGQPVAVPNQPGPQAVRGARFTSADLVRIEPEHYDGIAWCVTVTTGAFVARRNGKVFVTGNSGFPKSLDVSKAIDKIRDWTLVERLAGEIRRARVEIGLSLAEVGHAMQAATDGQYGKWYHRGGHMFFETGRGLPSRPEWEHLRRVLPIAEEFAGVYDAAEREVLGEVVTKRDGGSWAEQVGSGMFQVGERTITTTAPATDDARRWQGWGTALKPGFEPIVVARKPLVGTVVANVMQFGTGALNIDGCRIEGRERTEYGLTNATRSHGITFGNPSPSADFDSSKGRWPTNVVLSHSPLLDDDGDPIGDACADGCVPGCPVADLDGQSGTLTSGSRRAGTHGLMGYMGAGPAEMPAVTGDSGGASRFFPTFRYEAKAPDHERPRVDGVAHPTVKPLPLIRFLCRLVTQPGGLIVDMFGGSGTTGEAALMEGFDVVVSERDADYLPLIQYRVDRARRRRQPGVARLAKAKPITQADGQADLFADLFGGAA